MTAKRILLRILILCLAAGAVLGAVAVVAGADEIVGNTIGTLVLTAVCCGVLIYASTCLDDPLSHAAGIAMIGLVVAEFIVITSIIWSLPKQDWQEQEVELMADLLLCGGSGVVFLLARKIPWFSAAAWAGVAVCTAAFIVWLIGIVTGSDWDREDYWSEYAGAIGTTGALAALCLAGVGRDRWHWRWVGIACAVVGCVLAIRVINKDTGPYWPVVAFISAAAITAHANLVLRVPNRRGIKWLVAATIAAMIITGIFVTLEADTHDFGWSPTDRAAAASGILASGGTLMVAVLAAMDRGAAASAGAATITLICPLCGRRQTVALGHSECTGCHARIEVHVEPAIAPAAALPLPP